MAGLTVIGSGFANISCAPANVTVDKVKLGKTGLVVPRMAMGTGTVGYNRSSNQTRKGMDAFVKMAHHAYERGIHFFDMADGYGSHPFVGEAIKTLPREKLTLLSKVWTHEDGSENNQPVDKILDRFRQEIGTDYIDILLMHCMTQGGWDKNRTHYMDGLAKAKQDGIIRATGVSCHNIDALRLASQHPWVDVIMARLNPFGSKMDGTPDEISEILAQAQANGKGVIAMKVFGEGEHVQDDEREQSIRFALTRGNISCMTLGMESELQIDDAVERVMRLAKA
jgi:predicted aldo/keto reductase-like oxidoreductase